RDIRYGFYFYVETKLDAERRQYTLNVKDASSQRFSGATIRMLKLAIALVFLYLSTAVVYAETYNYSCRVCIFPSIPSGGYDGCDVDGKTYPLRVDDSKMSSNGGERNIA